MRIALIELNHFSTQIRINIRAYCRSLELIDQRSDTTGCRSDECH
jgi:hypothetical protein